MEPIMWTAGPPTLVVLSGLPGVGKTTIARRLAAEWGAIHLRLDTIEAALTASGLVERGGGWRDNPDVGYRIAWALTHDLLQAGHSVIADSVNPLAITRDSWNSCARDCGARLVNVEVICSDLKVHRDRVTNRVSDLEGLTVPTWHEARERQYEPWTIPVVRVDTATGTDDALRTVLSVIRCEP